MISALILLVMLFTIDRADARLCTRLGVKDGKQAFYCSTGNICASTAQTYYTKGVCEPCPAGRYEDGTQYSYASRYGYYYVATYTTENLCTTCPDGKSSGTMAGSVNDCKDLCQAGYYGQSAETCHKCPKGTYGGGTVAVEGCIECPTGKSSAEGSSVVGECSLCAPGKFGVVPNCEDCPEGQYSSHHGQGSCESCENGQVPNSAHTACVDLVCEGGQFQVNGACIDCDPGFYLEQGSTNDHCLECPQGYFSQQKAAICTPCAKGTYSHLGGQGHCDDCVSGYYTATEGATVCLACLAGKYSVHKADSCLDCPQGTYNPDAGSEECFPCEGSGSAASTCANPPSGSGTPPPHAGNWPSWGNSSHPKGNHTWTPDDDELKGDDYQAPTGGGGTDDKVLNGDDDHNPGSRHGKHGNNDDNAPIHNHNGTGPLPGYPTAEPTFFGDNGDPSKNSNKSGEEIEDGVIAAAVLAPLFFTGCGAFIFFFFFMKRSAKKGGGDGGERETPYESWMRARSAPAAADPQVTPELQPEVESTHNPMVHASALPPPPPLSTPLVDIETPAVDVEEQEEGTISKEDGNMTEFYGEHSDRVSAVDNPLNAGSEENIDL